VFTARYALSPNIRQRRFIFKGLIFGDILSTILLAVQSKAQVLSRLIAGIAFSNLAKGMAVHLFCSLWVG
jgi:hypothetical protein